MKMNKTIVDNRRKKLMVMIQNQGQVLVEEVANVMNVSSLTIRRDLQYWEEMGAVERFYGGAKLVQSFVENNDLENSNEAYKHAIAKYAAQYVEDGDTIFINTSSTALLVIKYIRNKQCTIITNNAKAVYMNQDPKVSIVLSGGELRFPKESMVGDFALNTINKVTASKCFLGCSGINVESGVTTAILPEVTINEAMVRRCEGAIFVLADHTKVGINHNFTATDLSKINYLITDNKANEQAIEELKEHQITVIKLDGLSKIEA